MKRILVIGEHSYIGTSFRDYAAVREPGWKVAFAGARNDEWKKVDFQAYDAILHAAAVVHKKEEPAMKELYHEVNARLPYDVAKKAKKSGVRKFLFLSTMAVYGEGKDKIEKDAPVHPETMYAKSKQKAERALKKLSDESFCVSIFRPPMVYGPGCPGNYRKLSKLAAHLPVFPKTDNKRSMIYIDNLCECLLQELIYSGESCRILCPQNEEYVNTSELVQEIRKAHGKGTVLIPFPQKYIQACAEKNHMLQKVFGNCRYNKEEGVRNYQRADFRESVRKTEGVL